MLREMIALETMASVESIIDVVHGMLVWWCLNETVTCDGNEVADWCHLRLVDGVRRLELGRQSSLDRHADVHGHSW